jgi:hypothetical protein
MLTTPVVGSCIGVALPLPLELLLLQADRHTSNTVAAKVEKPLQNPRIWHLPAR